MDCLRIVYTGFLIIIIIIMCTGRKVKLCTSGENSSVRAVLNRHNYYGDLVQRKYESRFAKGEKGCDVLDESQWIVTPNAHEAIISRELFEKVQIRLKAAQEARSTGVGWEDDERAFYNVFYCGDCKRKMCTRRSRGSVFYFCNALSTGMKENAVINLFQKIRYRKSFAQN